MKKSLIMLTTCLIFLLSACATQHKESQQESSSQEEGSLQEGNQSQESATTDNSLLDKMNYNIYTEKERQIIASSEKVKAKIIEEVSEDCNIYGIEDIKVRVEDIGGDELLAEYTIYKDGVEVCRIQLEEGVLLRAGVDIFYADITKDGERDIIIQPGEVGTFAAKWAFGYDLKNNTQIDIYKERWELMEANKVQLNEFLDDSFYNIFPNCEWIVPFNIYVDEDGNLYYDMTVGRENANTLGSLIAKAVYNTTTESLDIAEVFYARQYGTH